MKKNLFIAAMSLLVLAGCSSDDEIDNVLVNNDNRNAITFDTYVGKVTKAATAIDQDFGVFAYYRESGSDAIAPNFMYNQLVDKDGVYTPIKYWPEKGSIDFIAYSPLASVENGISLADYASGTTGLPIINFTLSATAKTDLLVSTLESKNVANKENVALTLGHKLSKITFKVNAPTATGTTIKVTSIKLTDVKSTAVFNFGTGWGTLGTATEFDASKSESFLMIPQPLTSIKAAISFTVRVDDPSLEGDFFEFTKTSIVNLTSSLAPNWEGNKQYSYTINPTASLDAVTISAAVEEWETPIEPTVP